MKRLFLLFVLFAALLVFPALGCTKKTTTNKTTNTTSATNRTTNAVVVTNTNATNLNVSSQTTEEEDLHRIAASFTERYGSFSNQSNYANFEALYAFMTTNFAAETKSYVAEQRTAAHDNSVYYGITTRATSVGTSSYSAGTDSASMAVQTLRREYIGSTNSARSYPESITISFEKQNGVWRVSGAAWEKKT